MCHSRITFDRWEDMKARVQDKVPGLLESVIVGMAKGEAVCGTRIADCMIYQGVKN